MCQLTARRTSYVYRRVKTQAQLSRVFQQASTLSSINQKGHDYPQLAFQSTHLFFRMDLYHKLLLLVLLLFSYLWLLFLSYYFHIGFNADK